MPQTHHDYQAWPCWATGPDGQTVIFESEEAVPDGWTHHGETKGKKTLHIKAEGGEKAAAAKFDHDGDGEPGGSTAAPATDELKALRAAYKEKFGKKPFGAWDADTLREKLA